MTEQNQANAWERGGASERRSPELPTSGRPSKVCNRLLIVRCFLSVLGYFRASQVTLVVKNLPANAGDGRGMGAIPGSRRSPGGEHGIPLQYSCLENPTDRGAWRATVQGVAESEAAWHTGTVLFQTKGNLTDTPFPNQFSA